MKKEDHYIDIIEKYQDGKLDKVELKDFEHRLATDEEFLRYFEDYNSAIQQVLDAGLKNRLKNYHNELFPKQNRIIRWPYIGIAASFILIIFSIYLFNTNSSSSSDLFNDYFEPYPNLITTRSSSLNLIQEGMESYSTRDYEKAVLAFDKVKKDDPLYVDMIFYKGVSQLALKNSSEAIELFTQVKDVEQFNEQVIWYSALSHLAQEDIKEASRLLSSIKEGDFKYVKSQQLLEQLKGQTD